MPKIYVDSNVVIIGRMIKESNSRLILEASERKTISLIISEDTLREVVEFFKRNRQNRGGSGKILYADDAECRNHLEK